MTGETGLDLDLPGRIVLATAKVDHFWKAGASVRAGNVNTSGPVTGFTALCCERCVHVFHVAVHAVFDSTHGLTGVAMQTSFSTSLGVTGGPLDRLDNTGILG